MSKDGTPVGAADAFEAALDRAFAAAPGAPSVSAAVSAPGLMWRGGRTRDEPSADNPADWPFRIASVTKPFVAAAAHRLTEEQRLSLHASAQDVLAPQTLRLLAEGGYDPTAIRLSHLLSHTSGLPDHAADPSYAEAIDTNPKRRWTRNEQVSRAMALSRLGAPGEVYSYSDTGYLLVAEAIERAADAPLAAAVRGLLRFEALGLSHTWWEEFEPAPPGALVARQLQGEADASAFDPSFDLYGGGGLISTVSDLARFIGALLTGAVLDTRTLVAALITPASRALAPAWRTHSYLLASLPANGRWVLGHTGHWSSVMAYAPGQDVAIAATLNQAGDLAWSAMRALADELFSAAIVSPRCKPASGAIRPAAVRRQERS